MLKCVVLDFDDTIVMSESIKRQLWYDMLDPKYDEMIREVYASKPFKDRYDLAQYFSEISGLSTQYLLESYASTLDEFFTSQKNIVPNVIPFFEHLRGMGVSLYINSATPQEFLSKAVDQSGLSHYFRGIYGDPNMKETHLRTAMTHCGATPETTIMIGDSVSDMEGASAVGCYFIGVDFDDTGKLNNSGCVRISDYGEMLLHILQKYNMK